jgi:hypothetical protein
MKQLTWLILLLVGPWSSPDVEKRKKTVTLQGGLKYGVKNTEKMEMDNVEMKVLLREKLVVPEGAIIDTDLRPIGFIDRGLGYFEPRDVKAGSKVDGCYEVIKGLKVGEQIVISANFLIDSASNLKEALETTGTMPRTAHGSHER